MEFHHCSERCKCPNHGLMMYYHQKSKSHACQNIECEYARGYEDALIKRFLDRRHRA